MNPSKILIVEDEEAMRFFLSEALSKEGHEICAVENSEEALGRFSEEDFDLVLLDYNLPTRNGLELFKALKHIHPDLVAILITGHGSQVIALDAMNQGLFDYFCKPVELDELRVVVRRGLERAHLLKEVQSLRNGLKDRFSLDRMLGNSRGMQEVHARIEMISGSDVSVLISGESGTGKELAAQAIHYTSPRNRGPLIKVNCAAVPQDLLEAEFFGYEKGAFTGAVKQKIGKFELASGGTLFLDEIGDMPKSTQMKILRVLQEKELERVGGETTIPIDIRLVAATNKNLEKAVAEGEFREDLFYRINVVSLTLPPLRERSGDIPVLANHFLEVYNKPFGKEISGLADDALEILQNYSWPGNVRELENVIQRAMVLSFNQVLDQKDLLRVYPALAEPVTGPPNGVSFEDQVQAVVWSTEKRLILEALEIENWKRQETADRLGVSRKTLHNKMKKYGLGQSARGQPTPWGSSGQ